MNKNLIINQIKTIARMNKYILKAEDFFGKLDENNEIYYIISEMVSNLIDLMEINDDEKIDEISNILFCIVPDCDLDNIFNQLPDKKENDICR
jgi:hypothetical protein